jgi:MoaA/NifB/PqqE/SkfB family radical SAM enzyme
VTTFYSEINPHTIHLEITDRCNASCPQCGRNKLGGAEKPHLPGAELTLEDIKKILPENTIGQFKRLYMCGNFGDPVVAKDTLEVFEYLREFNPNISLGMNTNGSARSTEWWTRMGKVFAPKGAIKFGIDGLKDTNHIYRRNTDFNKIIENASAFIAAGGRAQWEFLVFKHNEHQVDQARKLSEELGFEKFTLKKTGRFFSNTKIKTNDNQKVFKPNGDLDYIIEKPSVEEYQNKSLLKEQKIIEQFGSMETYLDETPVNCKVVKEGSLYISAEGLAFPCCWTANQLYLWYMPKETGPIWKILNKHGGKDAINAINTKLEEIANGSVFSEIKNSWSCSSLSEGKLKVCAKTCGDLFDQFKDQYK